MPSPLYMLLSSGDVAASGIIKWFTWSNWSHVDIYIGDDEVIGAVPFEGVVRRPIHEAGDPFAGEHQWFETAVPSLEASVQFLLEQEGKGYDWLGVFAFLRRRAWQDPDKWFCSELAAAACEVGGTTLLRSPHGRITPGDILKSPLIIRSSGP